jgi:hypothetical protein
MQMTGAESGLAISPQGRAKTPSARWTWANEKGTGFIDGDLMSPQVVFIDQTVRESLTRPAVKPTPCQSDMPYAVFPPPPSR